MDGLDYAADHNDFGLSCVIDGVVTNNDTHSSEKKVPSRSL